MNREERAMEAGERAENKIQAEVWECLKEDRRK